MQAVPPFPKTGREALYGSDVVAQIQGQIAELFISLTTPTNFSVPQSGCPMD
jgi:hypothetical protein